jgi:hypothetical protein
MSTRQLNRLTTALAALNAAQAPQRANPGGRAGRRRRRRARGVGGSLQTAPASAPTAGSAIVNRGRTIPRISMVGDSTIVQNTEVLASLNTSAAFTLSTHPLIVGNPTWLRGVAGNFSRFRWRRLRVIYIPACPTSTTGQIAMGLSYDAGDAAATGIDQIQAMFHSVSGPFWAGFEGTGLLGGAQRPIGSLPGAMALEVDCERISQTYWRFITLTGYNSLGSSDKDVFLPAQLFVGRSGGPAIDVLAGNLYLQYEVELVEPIPTLLN